jgi:1,5-anhydro-D-fructose reductase (1,5-anhydro-D-mannitol-forming)
VVGTRGMAVAVDTMGQTAGGSLTLFRPEPVDVPFAGTDPFTAQFAGFGAAVAGTAPWPYPAGRDLALHRLLVTALDQAADRPSAHRQGAPA